MKTTGGNFSRIIFNGFKLIDYTLKRIYDNLLLLLTWCNAPW